MKSSVNQAAFKEWALKVEKEEKEKFLAYAFAYGKAFKSNNNQMLEAAYRNMLNYAQQMEEKYQVKILESPDGNYYKAFMFIADIASQVYERIKKEQTQMHKAYFGNVRDANDWILKNKVDVVSMELETGTGLGLFANHTIIKKVTLGYRKNERTNYFYGIFEEEEFGFLIKKDTTKYLAKWKEKHPGLEIISQKYFSNTRGDALSLAVGFGHSGENFKSVTLYRGVRT